MTSSQDSAGNKALSQNSEREGASLKIIGYLIDSKSIIIFDIAQAQYLYKNGFFGRPIGLRKPKSFDFQLPIQLSLFEACYLLEKGNLEIYSLLTNERIDKTKLFDIANSGHPFFVSEYTVYKHLRERGFVVRPGLKFGARFAVYEHGPGIDHAPFLVHVLPSKAEITAIDILRTGRLATTVRKKFIISLINEKGDPEFYGFTWLKL